MPRGTQAKLPHTLPTPAAARAALRTAKAMFMEKAEILAGYEAAVKSAKADAKAAMVEIEAAERDLLDAEEGSKEDLAANAALVQALRHLDKAETALDGNKRNLPHAQTDLADAEKRLRGARGDLRAIAEGRRA